MEQKRVRIWRLAWIFLLVIFCCIGTKASAEEKITIKVGYNNSEFLYADSKNTYAGYGYELLQMIAQYEPIKYEYVYANFTQLRKMLKNGEIDLLAPMNRNEKNESIFDFTDLSIGSSQMVLSTRANSDLAERLSTDRIVVGMIENTPADLKSFQEYCKENLIDAITVPFNSYAMLKDALKVSSIDAIFSDRLDINGYQILCRFGARDMYCAVTKGNKDLLQYLNEGLEKMEADSPEYQRRLYDKYYSQNDITGTVLTSEEKKFVEELDTIKVAVPGQMIPFQYEQDGEFTGIHIDILHHISQKTGINFEYINTGSMKEAISSLKNANTDIIIGVADNTNWADEQGILLTSSYMDNVLTLAKPKESDYSDGNHILAVYNDNLKLSEYYHTSNLECNSLEECFQAVKSGEADFTFGNIYAVDYMRLKAAYRDFEISAVSESGGRFCFAMANKEDLTLYRIINKAVNGITSEMVEEAVANISMNRKAEFSLLGYIYDHTIGVISLIFAVAILVVILFIHFMRKNTALEKKITEKYRIIEHCYNTFMDITGDCVFEYAVDMDTICFSKKFSEKFGLERKYRNFKKFRMIESKIHPEDISKYEEFINRLLTKEIQNEQVGLRMTDGEHGYEKSYIYGCSISAGDGKVNYILGRFFDENTKIMERKKSSHFKGIYSYLEIKDMILHMLEQSEQREKHVMILMNIYEHFEDSSNNELQTKHIGYEKESLLRAAECIQSCVRETDIIGRSGDGQLLLFMTRIQSREQIENKLERIKQLLREEFYSDYIKIMVGYSVYPLQGSNYEELYEKAMSDMTEL